MDMKCPYCGAVYEVEQNECGNTVKCEICGMSFVIDYAAPTKQLSTGSILETIFIFVFVLVGVISTCRGCIELSSAKKRCQETELEIKKLEEQLKRSTPY